MRLAFVVAVVALIAIAAGCSRERHAERALAGTPAAAVATRRVAHPHPMIRGGHRVRSFLLGHAPDAGEQDANTPFGDFWWIGASSTATSAIPNSGVRMEADVLGAAPPAAANGCFSVWTSDTLSNDMWGQIGYSVCDLPSYPFYNRTAFFQVWDLSIGPGGELLVDQESDDLTPGLHTFAMYLQSGTTWAYAVDGNVMGVCDMGSATGNAPFGVTTLSEEGDGVATAFTPPSVAMPVAMEVLSGGAWGPAATATVVNTAGISGVVGALQDPSLADDQIVIGGSSPTLDSGVVLWNGTATDGGLSTASDAGTLSEPFVQVACPMRNATVGGKLLIPITATSPAGIAAVSVSVDGATDYDGGSYAALCNFTAPPYACEWDTTGESDGPYFLYVAATDGNGKTTYEDVLVHVSQGAGSACPAVGDGGALPEGGAADAGNDAQAATDAAGSGADAASIDAGDGGATSPSADAASDTGPAAEDGAVDVAGSGQGGSSSSGGCGCDAAGERRFGAESLLALGVVAACVGFRRRRWKANGAPRGVRTTREERRLGSSEKLSTTSGCDDRRGHRRRHRHDGRRRRHHHRHHHRSRRAAGAPRPR